MRPSDPRVPGIYPEKSSVRLKRLRWSQNPQPQQRPQKPFNFIFVSNLNDNVTEVLLRKEFSQLSHVKSVYIPKHLYRSTGLASIRIPSRTNPSIFVKRFHEQRLCGDQLRVIPDPNATLFGEALERLRRPPKQPDSTPATRDTVPEGESSSPPLSVATPLHDCEKPLDSIAPAERSRRNIRDFENSKRNNIEPSLSAALPDRERKDHKSVTERNQNEIATLNAAELDKRKRYGGTGLTGHTRRPSSPNALAQSSRRPDEEEEIYRSSGRRNYGNDRQYESIRHRRDDHDNYRSSWHYPYGKRPRTPPQNAPNDVYNRRNFEPDSERRAISFYNRDGSREKRNFYERSHRSLGQEDPKRSVPQASREHYEGRDHPSSTDYYRHPRRGRDTSPIRDRRRDESPYDRFRGFDSSQPSRHRARDSSPNPAGKYDEYSKTRGSVFRGVSYRESDSFERDSRPALEVRDAPSYSKESDITDHFRKFYPERAIPHKHVPGKFFVLFSNVEDRDMAYCSGRMVLQKAKLRLNKIEYVLGRRRVPFRDRVAVEKSILRDYDREREEFPMRRRGSDVLSHTNVERGFVHRDIGSSQREGDKPREGEACSRREVEHSNVEQNHNRAGKEEVLQRDNASDRVARGSVKGSGSLDQFGEKTCIETKSSSHEVLTQPSAKKQSAQCEEQREQGVEIVNVAHDGRMPIGSHEPVLNGVSEPPRLTSAKQDAPGSRSASHGGKEQTPKLLLSPKMGIVSKPHPSAEPKQPATQALKETSLPPRSPRSLSKEHILELTMKMTFAALEKSFVLSEIQKNKRECMLVVKRFKDKRKEAEKEQLEEARRSEQAKAREIDLSENGNRSTSASAAPSHTHLDSYLNGDVAAESILKSVSLTRKRLRSSPPVGVSRLKSAPRLEKLPLLAVRDERSDKSIPNDEGNQSSLKRRKLSPLVETQSQGDNTALEDTEKSAPERERKKSVETMESLELLVEKPERTDGTKELGSPEKVVGVTEVLTTLENVDEQSCKRPNAEKQPTKESSLKIRLPSSKEGAIPSLAALPRFTIPRPTSPTMGNIYSSPVQTTSEDSASRTSIPKRLHKQKKLKSKNRKNFDELSVHPGLLEDRERLGSQKEGHCIGDARTVEESLNHSRGGERVESRQEVGETKRKSTEEDAKRKREDEAGFKREQAIERMRRQKVERQRKKEEMQRKRLKTIAERRRREQEEKRKRQLEEARRNRMMEEIGVDEGFLDIPKAPSDKHFPDAILIPKITVETSKADEIADESDDSSFSESESEVESFANALEIRREVQVPQDFEMEDDTDSDLFEALDILRQSKEDADEGLCGRTRLYLRHQSKSIQKKRLKHGPVVSNGRQFRAKHDILRDASHSGNGGQSSRQSRQMSRIYRKGVSLINPNTDIINLNSLQQRRKKVYFQRSTIHGMGLFAEEVIEEGEFIAEYMGEIIRRTVADMREKIYKRQGMGDSYLFRLTNDLVVDATRRGGIARFINHCCDPNVMARMISVNGMNRIVFYSKRTIKVDEELTYDYKFEYEAEDKKIACLCGAATCRKFLNYKDEE